MLFAIPLDISTTIIYICLLGFRFSLSFERVHIQYFNILFALVCLFVCACVCVRVRVFQNVVAFSLLYALAAFMLFNFPFSVLFFGVIAADEIVMGSSPPTPT